jgi:acetyl esterase
MRKQAEHTDDAPLLEPLTQQFVDALADLPIANERSPAGLRRLLKDVQSGIIGKPAALFKDVVVPAGPTGSVPVRIVRPEGSSEALPR